MLVPDDTDNMTAAQLLPGEGVVQTYSKVVAHASFRAVLTNRRLLFVRRRALEDFHLAHISSLAWRSHFRWNLVAAGAALATFALLDLVLSLRLTTQYDGMLLTAGIVLIACGLVFQKHGVTIYAAGRKLSFFGNSQKFSDFIRDVRRQQSQFALFSPTVSVVSPPVVILPPAPLPPPVGVPADQAPATAEATLPDKPGPSP
jgi:hypothetical protein